MAGGGAPSPGRAGSASCALLRLCVLLAVAATVALPAPAAAQTQAPALWVDGQTIRWRQVGSVTHYWLATKVPGRATAYQRITCTVPPNCAHTPPAVSGAT